MADSSTTAQKVAAEVLGTFVLVFFGCGSVVFANNAGGGADYVAVGFTFGLAVLLMAYAVGRISGGHFNPAVTIGAAMGGRIAWRQTLVYIGSQLAGAIVAGLALFVLLHGFDDFDSEGNMGQNFFGDQGSGYAWWAAFLLELILTFLFVTVILAVTDARFEHPALAPLAIGLTLTAIHFVAIPATGTSVNPARSIGPALFAGTDAIVQLWLFILAPLIGGAVGGLVYPLLFGHGTEPVPGSGLVFARPTTAAVPGYGAPDQFQQEWNQQAAEQAAWEQEPIIQDGWQWDHAAQEWKPLEQWQPAQPAQSAQPAATPEATQIADPTPTPAPTPAPPAVTDPAVSPGEQPPAQPGWTDPSATQERPPQ
ncbi:MIP family channel protein [Nocardioides anomalus]|uniref:MIP family channel protein n=1 Tax=Nocardioides anomalus TaxID=2712223 RepID=A0A6G6WG15_9ACTN|nr:MIP family channel protein [Nocardioides anomalus]QIG44149.1 MIP family channel protein [Nocardioides anomalus]